MSTATTGERTAPAAGLDLRDIEQFLYREARYADEHDYDAWEALWTDDALYWVPAGTDAVDPDTQVSVIYDNRSRIGTRLKQLRTGKRYAQSPPSNLRRVISNVEVLGTEGTNVTVGANFVVVESRTRGLETWAGRATYRLRVENGEIRLAYKKVVLVNSGEALPTLAFLI
ncbi:beta subunit of hydroxylase component of benzoate 1,2-dioxygenase [Streptomyces albus]|uniref:Beta subunit of hydroxylase component of benzoate 1,2-dioxygenase n=1 Tax=Streptomyces albus (strain ATCC 21838 / DSM 41398 / FERM P-419 / JCM 4703 / NBRC 107858) TaxID=1081613 RepID=A0A0B5EQK3_STRA4|nr:beta subunit of hydroxylase component of benzoate 1,2-dioxygenase [Streptomyces albus]AOU74757.1 beta subunit of hydroxylase component of benzoate 1,2-dioxygenase [Streptomyces albus]AYN30568.1 dioxygenase [Streptomyces albus]